MERKPTRYAHSDGHTDVCYSEDGEHLITCGSDGDIRIWAGFDDDDPVQTCVGEWALCVSQKGKKLYIATDKNNVQIMTFPEAERDGILIRFTAHVNHLDTGKNHNYIAIVSEDMEVKLIDLSKESDNITSFPGLTGPPLSVALCPKARMLAVASGDGMLRIWNIHNSSIIKEIQCVSNTNSFMNAEVLCRIHFDPISGRTLAYPHKNTVIIVDTTSWSEKLILICSEMDSTFSIVEFSPCGELLAAASQHGDLVIWHILTQNVIGITKHPKRFTLCAIAWNPKGNGEIAFCDINGQLGVVNCVKPTISNDDDDKELSRNPAQKEKIENGVDFGDFQFDNDDEDDENVISLEKIKKDIMGTESDSEIDKASFRSPTPRPRTPEVPLQSAFMPSSTPEHLNPRYLCWNEIGIIRSFGGDDNDNNNTIEVEFHDATLHNSMMIQNFRGYTMGSLSITALTLANSNFVATIPLSAGSKEWNINIPEEQDEEIVCIACSENLVCLGTSIHFIRVFSIFGTQKSLFSVPGPLVCMSARSNMLLSAYHYSSSRKNDQCINTTLTKLEGLTVENKDLKCALRPESKLLWLGFSDSLTPASQDSSGILYLHPETSNVWMPFCNTKKHCNNLSDGFFVTAVFESSQSIHGIQCRGSMYPSFIPRPALSEIPLEPPFIEINTEKSQLEANLFTWSLLKVTDVEKKLKESALKTFALACRNNLDQRALELIGMLENPQLVALSIKYATKLNRRRLAEKLTELAGNLENCEYEDTSFNSNIPSQVFKPINRKLVLSSSKKNTPKHSNLKNDKPVTPVICIHNLPRILKMLRTQAMLLTTVAALLIYIIIKRRRRRLRSQRRKIFLQRESRRLQRHKTFLQKEKRRLQWRQTLLQKRNAPSTSTAKTSSEDEHSSSFQSTENSTIQSTTTAEVSFDMNTPPVRSNPFLKSKKPSETVGYNPLSLTDKFAGYSEEIKSKETTPLLNNGKSEKRKQSDSEVDKPKDKQRKLEKFMFSKNPKL